MGKSKQTLAKKYRIVRREIRILLNDQDIAANVGPEIKRLVSIQVETDWDRFRSAALEEEHFLIGCSASRIPPSATQLKMPKNTAIVVNAEESIDAIKLAMSAIQTPSDRMKLAKGARKTAEMLERKVSAVVEKSSKRKRIMDAWKDDTHLIVEGEKRLLVVPWQQLPVGKDEAFEIHGQGSYLHWSESDAHLGWEQLEQLVNPQARLQAQQRSKSFNKRYGSAIRTVRRQKGLTQNDIAGVDPRHLRRIEGGANRATAALLKKLAKAHGMETTEYMQELSKKMRR